jgi:Mycothiol maleylpyruvate isomerase N-terminal domain
MCRAAGSLDALFAANDALAAHVPGRCVALSAIAYCRSDLNAKERGMKNARVPAAAIQPRGRISGAEVWQLAEAEYGHMLELLRHLDGDNWQRQTDCTAWDVRAILGHLVGALEGYASPLQMAHQYWLGCAGRGNGG